MNEKTLTFYEFDEFRLDAARKCLWHSDELVSLTPKAFETLLVLIKHRGEVVGKDVLLDEVWADTFVEESTLSQNILTLRKTLAAFSKDKQFIITVPRRGYRFVADVKEIVGDEEFFVVERRTRTRFVAEQKEIHDSAEAEKSETAMIVKPTPHKLFSKKYLYPGMVLFGLIVLTAGFLAFRYFWRTPEFVETKFQKFKISNLFSDANILRAIISPNGKYLALIEKSAEGETLLLRQIEEANSLEIVPKFDGQFIGVTFAPESDYIFYAVYPRSETNIRHGELYRIPILGGASQQIVKDIDSPVSVSADKKRIAFVRRDRQEKETALIIADIDGANEQKLAVRKFGESFLNAAFSPDGKFIACIANSKESLAKPMEIVVVNAASGEQKRLTTQNWLWIGQTAWLTDGSGIALVGYGAKSPNLTDEVWLVSFPEGKARMLESGVNGVFGVSLTDDADSLVTVKSNKITSFLISSVDDLENSKTLLTKTGDESLLPLGADWTADNAKIIYSTTNNGNADIWTINADGTGQKQITSSEGADFSPKVSADGRFIYFLSNRSGLSSVWRVNSDGTNPQKLTDASDVFSVNLSPDGKWIYYTARADSVFTQTLWRVSVDGQDAKQLTEKTVILPRISPDGKMLACYYPDAVSQTLKLTLLSAETGEVLRQFGTPRSEGLYLLEWKKDAQNLLFAIRKNAATILWQQPIDGAEAKKLKQWQNESVFRLAVSGDGEKIFYEKGTAANSVVLLRDVSAEQ